MSDPVELAVGADGTATISMNRPQLHNAFDEVMIAALTHTCQRVGADPHVRRVVLEGRGKSFSAGADLNWMRRSAAYTPDQNRADAMGLGRLMRTLNDLPKPVIGLVQGAAFGGGAGLAACCDIVIAAEDAKFCFSEVRLGLIPAVISPYVIAAIGPHQARRYFCSAEVIPAPEAMRIGLAHIVAPRDGLAAARDAMIATLAQGGPEAQADAKALVADVAHRVIDDSLVAMTARRIADRRATAEAREGLTAFLEKRPPAWREG
ncbi:MAG TPA: enoyl-CoA hydratase-related protein [Acidiphilium sp.]|nr:enoyl-CoA hydratase-related protein [Acidiphilium sp.]